MSKPDGLVATRKDLAAALSLIERHALGLRELGLRDLQTEHASYCAGLYASAALALAGAIHVNFTNLEKR